MSVGVGAISRKVVAPMVRTNHRALKRRALGAPLLILLLLLPPGRAWAADEEACRRLRQQRDALAAAAIEQEIALARWFRMRLCPRLSAQAEQANAKDGVYSPMDYAAWSRCRLEAERRLENTRPVRFRNLQGFTFYTPEGATLARQADELARQRRAKACP